MTLRQRLAESRPLYNLFMTVPAPALAERMGVMGVESITLDLQHGSIEDAHVLGLLQAIRAGGATSLCRLAWNRPELIMKALDYGAEGIICPMVDSAAEAEAFVRAAKYPPLGNRSFGPFRANLHHRGDYFADANDHTLTFVMIETAGAVAELDKIAATPGLDGLYIGPWDLSVSLGLAERANFSDPTLSGVLDRVVEVGKANGLFTGIFTIRPGDVEGLVARGFDLVTCGTEDIVFQHGLGEWMKVWR
ncbi:4-hydroxy-2-oxoheptanedioate aldolase [Lewinella marina]|uniref:2,4-dihydroxyhept-2-ene-1,7-dioic acid aldolase n=1 Tax=Neolewinella marina TaxID=438751 RepID=A0A2G0CDX5_9BACT|nr:aldolase/citrate lyase family protein [Neolewinella marina]NJB87518.1 4-hydroxy-2-oxoheptanedioate aldolase [Neolewinella marina]PHK98176.1 2,4-dihydroxyhept-2-ene-1,7-dioic acid aldolase [Neolewinella marina]